MILGDGGYSDTQFDTDKLRYKAGQLANVLPHIMRNLGADCVAVTGKSGISLAFATLMLIDFPVMVVRKRGENSHGNPIEGTHGHDARRYLILDDFISSGNTVRNIVAQITERATLRGLDHAPECVGVLEYLRNSTGKHVRISSDDSDVYTKVPVFGVLAG